MNQKDFVPLKASLSKKASEELCKKLKNVTLDRNEVDEYLVGLKLRNKIRAFNS
jgi:hypothetical protein